MSGRAVVGSGIDLSAARYMAGKDVRVHAYHVNKAEHSQPLEEVLEAISQDPVPNRQRTINGSYVRMDDVRKIDADIWVMDFVLRRYEGPGRSPDDAETSSFQMGKKDRFGEETAGLYHVPSQRLLLQYNHRGIKLGRALEFLSSYVEDSANAFDGLFELDPKWRAKLKRRNIPKEIEAAVSPGLLSKNDRDENLAARHAMQMSDYSGANHVVIKLNAKNQGSQKGSLNIKRAISLRDSLMRLAARKPDAITSLNYKGRTAPDAAAQALDLLKCRLQKTIKHVPIDEGRRVNRENRYTALQRTWKDWKSHFES